MKTFIILGMHRSATSLVSEGFKRCGINMGDLLNDPEYPEHNRMNWEDPEFTNMNREILSLAGGHWDDPPSPDKIKTIGITLKNEIKALVSRKNAPGVNWGWKDPRTTLTIDLYMPYLVKPHFYICFRDPADVAESLRIRNGFSFKKGRNLAIQYNNRLLDFMRRWHIANNRR